MSVSVDRSKIPRTYREYIEKLKEAGEAVEIDDEIDTHLEIGAVRRHAYETRAPMPIFNKIKGTPEGFRACDIGYSKSGTPGKEWCRLAIMLGLPPETSLMDIQKAYIEAKEGTEVHEPVIVDPADAPCKQNKWTGDEVDITKIPAPLAHDGDVARYIGTAGVNIVQTPDKSWTSWSINRAMIVNENTMTGLWLSTVQHNGMVHLTSGAKEGKDTPWAMAFGVPPVGSLPSIRKVSRLRPASTTTPVACSARAFGWSSARPTTCWSPPTPRSFSKDTSQRTSVESEGPFGEYQGYMPSSLGQPRNK